MREFPHSTLRTITCPFRWRSVVGGVLACLVVAIPFAKADYLDEIGYAKLKGELGAQMVTGSEIAVTQVEASSAGSYRPDFSNGELIGKQFVYPTNSGTALGISDHATTVGRYFYGLTSSQARGIGVIHVYDANSWLQAGFLRFGTSSSPLSETASIQNHSWVGYVDNGGVVDTELLRRYDYAIQQDNFLGVSALNNGSNTAIPSLLASSYNGIVVGMTNGGHSSGTTLGEGTGRIKPDLVSPMTLSSWTAPTVGSAAALLLESARNSAALSSATNSMVIKALLMAGATKNQIPGWNRTSIQPLDSHYGVGQLNIYNSYQVLAAGRQVATNKALLRARGWDFRSTARNGNYYFFDIAPGDVSSGFSALLTWNRVVSTSLGAWSASLPNLALKLHNASGFTIGSLVDSSLSTIDNVQHIYQPGLPPGRYALLVSSSTIGVNYGLAWNSVPTLTITATLPDAYEQGNTSGLVSITRSGEIVDPLTVNYTLGGTALAGTDFTPVATSVTIPSGTNAIAIPIVPISNDQPNGVRTVSLSLNPDLGYSIGSSGSATVMLHDKPFDAWRFSVFSTEDLATASIIGALADPDGDGIPNLTEYALNLNPKSLDVTGLPAHKVENNILSIAYTRPKAATDVTLIAEVSTDLIHWNSGSAFTTVLEEKDNGTTTSLKVGSVAPLSSEPKQFIRLRITKPQ